MDELLTRWIVFYRRYSSGNWSEDVKKTEREARDFVRTYLNRGPEAQAYAKEFVEVKGKSR